jgi:Fe-Mn family superoxide dismutase
MTVPQIESKGFFTTAPPLAAESSTTPRAPCVGQRSSDARRFSRGYTVAMKLYAPMKTYGPRKWDLAGLHGISDATLETHFGLYEGYVKNANLLNEQLAHIRERGENQGANPQYAEIVRRLGFEYDGMRLHEYYFDNLTKNAKGDPSGGPLHEALGRSYGGFDAWKSDFTAVGGMRGAGWAIAYLDTVNGQITNHWIDDHENGHVAGFVPIVVMDVWEHAWIKDYEPAEKGKYIEAFFANLDWSACEARLPH